MSRPGDGLRAWMLQRLSAVYLALYLTSLPVVFYLDPVTGYPAWRDWVARPLVTLAAAGFILALLLHVWVGMRDVVLDYLHQLGIRLLILTLIALCLAGCGFWAIRILILAGR